MKHFIFRNITGLNRSQDGSIGLTHNEYTMRTAHDRVRCPKELLCTRAVRADVARQKDPHKMQPHAMSASHTKGTVGVRDEQQLCQSKRHRCKCTPEERIFDRYILQIASVYPDA